MTVEDKGAWEEVFSYARSLADLPGTPSDAPTKGDIHWVSRRLQRNPSLVNSNPTFRNQVEAIVRFVSERADVRVEAALEKTLIWLSREKDARDSAALQRDSRRFGSAEEAVFPLVDHILPSPSPWRSLLEQLDRFGYTPDDQRRLIHFVIQHNLLTVFPERRNFCHTRADVIQPLLRHSNLFDDSRSIQARALAFFLRNLGSGVAYRLELIPNSESLVIAEGWMFSVEDIRINAYVFLDHPENLPEVFDILQGSDIDRPFRLVKIFYEGNDIRREELKRLVNSYAPEGRFGGSVQKLQGSTVEIEATGSGLDPSTSLPSTSLRA
ncbi:MAG: hypothetical protein HYU99_05325, partial [Deltaproteobacteria bacterium]|nr:hypothetical protein [Deltaproteobacteria bacterium]